jgi:hypothetical protein
MSSSSQGASPAAVALPAPAAPSVSAVSSATPPSDPTPLAIATEAHALALLRDIPEAHEPILFGTTFQKPQRMPRELSIKRAPTPGCIQGDDSCRWEIRADLHLGENESDDEAAVRMFYVDARTGAVTARMDNDWPNDEKVALPMSAWHAIEKREERAQVPVKPAWPMLDRLNGHGLLMFMTGHKPEPDGCFESASTPCRFRFSACWMGMTVTVPPCLPTDSDYIGSFVVTDGPGTADTVEAEFPLLTSGDGAVPLARLEKLAKSLASAERAMTTLTCRHAHPRIDDVGMNALTAVERVGCGEPDPACRWAIHALIELGGQSHPAVMIVESATGITTVRDASADGGDGVPFAAWCSTL